MRQLWQFKFFGVPRQNVVIVVQPRHPGYTYDAQQRTWHKGPADNSVPLGSGWGARAWTGGGGRRLTAAGGWLRVRPSKVVDACMLQHASPGSGLPPPTRATNNPVAFPYQYRYRPWPSRRAALP